MSKEFIDVIYKDKRYKDIIKHRNFNPRIIEFITNSSVIGDIKSENYWSYILQKLNNPEVIWENYFKNQTDDFVRALTFLTVFNNGKISEDNLRDSYNTFLTIHPSNSGDSSDKNFESVRKLATKSLLNINQVGEKKYEYVLFNPSIADFVLAEYSNSIDLICNILKSLNSELSIDYLHTLLRNNKINKVHTSRILKNLFDFFYESKLIAKDYDFLLALSYIDIFDNAIKKRLEDFLKLIINTDKPSGDRLWELLYILTEFEPKIKFLNFEFLNGFIYDVDDEDTLIRLFDFVDENDIDDINILNQISILLDKYLLNIVNDNYLDIDYSKYITNSYNYFEKDVDIDINIEGIQDEIRQNLDSFLEGFNEKILDKISFSTSDILSSIDIDSKVNRFLENYEPDYDMDSHGGSYSEGSNEDDIDAIFER